MEADVWYTVENPVQDIVDPSDDIAVDKNENVPQSNALVVSTALSDLSEFGEYLIDSFWRSLNFATAKIM